MQMKLTTEAVGNLTLTAPPPCWRPTPEKAEWTPPPNYLVYDSHRDAPVGFGIRVGKKASVYLVEKLVAKKKLKIYVGLAAGKKGAEIKMSLDEARKRGHKLIAVAKKHGANPKVVADKIEASELTMGQIWDKYVEYLMDRKVPAKQNSLDSLAKAREKLSDWEDRKIALISGDEIMKRFKLHAVVNGHPTAAEAMGRWASSAVQRAIKDEVHDAFAAQRKPALTYNPFTILNDKDQYRNTEELKKAYEKKGIRNPMSFATDVGPFVKEAWAYRAENPLAADFMLLALLWGMRGDECRTFKWRDRISDDESFTARWIDLDAGKARVNDAKNRDDHEIAIGPCAARLLQLRREAEDPDSVWVFPSRSALNEGDGHYRDPTVALNTIRKRAGIKVLRGHDLRRTFGRACERLGFSIPQTQRLLGHKVEGRSTSRYIEVDWSDLVDRMSRIEEMILATAPAVWNALRPRSQPRMADTEDVKVSRERAKAKRGKAGKRAAP